MRCPICGSKMVQNQLCKYCKITDEQVINASNKKVKEYRKNEMHDMIHFSTVVPKDVSRLTLIMYTIFLGLVGVNHYYVKRPVRGTYAVVSTALSVVMFIVSMINPVARKAVIFELLFEIAFYAFVINIIMWIGDIINVFIKKFKIPVVLADKESLRK